MKAPNCANGIEDGFTAQNSSRDVTSNVIGSPSGPPASRKPPPPPTGWWVRLHFPSMRGWKMLECDRISLKFTSKNTNKQRTLARKINSEETENGGELVLFIVKWAKTARNWVRDGQR